MNARAASWLAWSLLALSLLFTAVGCLLWLSNAHPPSGDTWYTLAFLAFPLVGVVIAARRPENPIGWLFCIIGLANGLFFISDEYLIYALSTRTGVLPGAVWLAWSQLWTVFIMWSLMFFSLLLFPTGRLPSPRWRPVAWGLAVVFTLVTLLFVIKPGPLEGIKPAVGNPTGIKAAAGIVKLGENAVLPAVLIIVLAAPAAVLVRFWRLRGEERQQLKWLAYAAGLWVGVAALDTLNQSVLREPVIDYATGVLFGAAVAPIPVAVGIAILRYRLYEIDVVINKTLVYGTLTVSLALIYFGSVVGLQYVFRTVSGQETQLAVVASTLAIAALFNPLRRRIRASIDRRFYRRKFDAAKTLEAFSARLRKETDLDRLNAELLAAVRETMQPEHVNLWLREPNREGRR